MRLETVPGHNFQVDHTTPTSVFSVRDTSDSSFFFATAGAIQSMPRIFDHSLLVVDSMLGFEVYLRQTDSSLTPH